MPTAQLWHTRPVFITSTFRDMQKERDYLRDKVFPELMEKLRDRRHRLEPIDLRWGVETVSLDEEQSKELLVLKVCFGEIERSRPFLIALIGDRYGWIPPQERLAAAAAEADFKGDVTGKSITALEIEYGILEMPGQRRRSRFYFRQPLPYNKMPPDIAAIYSDRHNPDGEDAHNRLEALKQRIREDPQLKGRVHEYSAEWDPQSQSVTGLEAFGKMVLEQLWDDLDEETQAFLHAPTPSWQEQERWVLEEFVQNRSRRFVGRRGITDEILRHALAPDAPEQPQGLCLTGEPGSGKSALFSHLYRLLQEEDVLLLANASGISLRSAEVDAILQRWIEELAQFLGEASPLPDKPTADELQEQFTRLLGRAGSRNRVVLLLDALNQLEQTPRARQLTWLPRQWPANVRLIATSLPGPEAEALCSRDDVAHKKLPLLEPPEAREIIDAICGRYHRRIHAEVAGVLLDKKNEAGQPAGGNPLWLELAVEELNLLDADDFSRAERKYTGSSDERLHQLLLDTARQLPAEVEGLYDWMLARNEEVNGLSWSRAFSVAVALGRGGWRESDLRVLLPEFSGEPWDDLRFAVLRRSFRAHLVQRGGLGQYDFFHQQMRLAISRRYLGDAGLVRDSHNQIADYLASLIPSDPLRQNERMYHLIAADNQVAAAHYYAGALDQAELDGATRALAGPVLAGWGESPNPGLSWILGLLYVKGLSDEEKGIICQRFNFYLNDVLENNCDLSTRLALLQPVQGVLGDLAASDPSNSSWQRDLSVSFDRVGDVFSAQGDLAAALKAYQNSLAIAEKLAASDPSNSSWQRDLWVSYWRMALMSEEAKDGLASSWWRKAYDKLYSMKKSGLFISPEDEKYLAILQQKAGIT